MPSNKVNFALVGEDETSRTSRHASISSDNATDSERETQIKAAQIALQKQALGPARMQRLRTSRVKEPQFFCGPRKRGKTGEEAAEVDSWTSKFPLRLCDSPHTHRSYHGR